ncbi:alkaline phosphatase D family protein [Sphingomonas yantingensis]|uniref:Alkaline phosphatase D n=1 Tax=Sphingomonas yantingensis TaxID=1241761 RepID=A0A7W9AT59_9SPHN|nr:alkaline phosphatase D family protein [Sphingomonas yantingensis]MBB5700104.1 alkaline phosphatase D [Sphingomonas yantingensis]
MTLRIDRRSLIVTGTLGLGAFALPGFARQATIANARGFTHSVASGEPGATTMLLWTRYVPADGAPAKVKVEVAETPDFARVVGGAEMVTGPWRDHTVKLHVTGLKPGTRYHYRFVAPDGTTSPVGRTKTLPEGPVPSFKAAIFSCSNYGFGFFNAYAHAAARADLDLAIHLGDYIYEYAPANYPAADQVVANRVPQPFKEIVALADYRLRYASYRADRDLQALHAAMPMVVQWDDHESANDSWEGGAQNHQAEEGDWNARRSAAVQAYREWLPVSEEPWKAYDIGSLATLYRTETRLFARSQPPELAPLFLKGGDPIPALKAFRDGPWQDPSVTMMGTEQEGWLDTAMAASVRAGTRWQVVGFGTIMGNTRAPAEAVSWLKPDAAPRSRAWVQAGVTAGTLGLPSNLDNWGGYPAARARFLKSAQAYGGSTVVICGDSHNAWAYDLAQDGKPAAVEFAGQGVTSPGYESAIGVDPRQVAAAMVAANPELKWCDTSRRGYMALTLTPDRATNEWLFVDTIRQRSPRVSDTHRASTEHGRNVMA